MKVNKFLSDYLRAVDLIKPVTITVERVEERAFDRNGKEEKKLVLFHAGDTQGVILAKTQIKQLTSIFKSDDTDEWIGKKAVMFNDPDVWFQGKQVGGIRFRPLSGDHEEPNPF